MCLAYFTLSSFAWPDEQQKQKIASPPSPSASKPQPPDKRVRDHLDKGKLEYTTSEDGTFEVVFKLPEERSQKVYIHSRTESFKNAPPGFNLRRILSLVAVSDDPFSPRLMESFLQENARMKVGNWGVIKKENGQHLLFCVALVPAEADYNNLLFTAGLVAATADSKERELSKADQH